jgi:5'-3' exonuclease
MREGQTVYWQRSGGRSETSPQRRPVETQIRRIETITRPDGSKLTCATLTCNRFVPVTELLESYDGHRKPLETQSQDRDHQSDFGSRPGRPEEAETSDLSSVSVRTTENASVQDLAGRGPDATGTVFTERPTTEPKETEQAKKTRQRGGPDSVERATAGPDDAFRLEPPRAVARSQTGHNGCGPLLIDFNNLLVRAWHAGVPSEIHAVKSMFLTVASAVRSLRPSGIVFCMDGGHDHRAKLYPAYKAHRPPSDPDLVRQRKLAMDAIDFAGLQLLRAGGFEADDVIATLAKRERAAVILSSDKDLLSLAGHARIYHPWGAGKFVTPEDVLGVPAGQVLDYLALCGDTTDGVPGVKGIGEKTAQKLLSEHSDLETILTKARFMHIPGTMGKNLRDGAADALLSQQLVQLVTNLQLAELQPWRPRHGWQQRLTEIRLGAIAGILDGIVDLLASGGLQSPDDTRIDARTEPRTNRHQGIDIPRSPDLDWLRTQYESGRKHSGRGTENPWKRDSLEFRAWDQGFWNVPFSMDAESPAESREPATTAAGSLFD